MEQVQRWTEEEPLRIETAIESLAQLPAGGETLATTAHEARNMVTVLGLYCDLLQEPGVLMPSFQHYAQDLKLVAATSRRLVEKLTVLQTRGSQVLTGVSSAQKQVENVAWIRALHGQPQSTRDWNLLPSPWIRDLAEELRSNRNLLAALAGSATRLSLETEEGALPVRMTSEDLTRVLVNLVKNAVEAMPEGGRIHIGLREIPSDPDAGQWLALTVEDNGPGIPAWAIDQVFEAGYTTRTVDDSKSYAHCGLGLAITRSIVEAAGGRIHAANRDPGGACFQMELPVQLR